MDVKLQTEVLIVGSGPAGTCAALALSTYGTDNIVITKDRWTANTPRAHITGQRTMETFRDLGVLDDVYEKAAPQSPDGRDRLLHQPGGRGVRSAQNSGHALRTPRRIPAGKP